MHRITSAIVLILTLAGCAGDPGAEAPGDAPDGQAWTFVAPPEQPPARPPGGFVNLTPEEDKALFDRSALGHLDLEVRDAETGAPVRDWSYHRVRFALDEATVDAHIHIQVDSFEREETPTGRNRVPLGAGWYRLGLAANGYRRTWTPRFRIEKEKDTSIAMTMLKANRLRVHVLDEHGDALAEGTVLLVGETLRSALLIKDGVGERLVDIDEVRIEVGRVFMEDYARQSVPVTLERGKLNEVTIRLKRP
jgi:hypothetical protein